MTYVGYATIAADTGETDRYLRELIDRYTQTGTCFFLRSLHQVSGIITALPEKLSPEGQLFNANVELRWKKRRRGYELLWLGQQAPEDSSTFTTIPRQWQTEDHPALLHDRRTPQYPNLFKYPDNLKSQIRQRYFRDQETGIIHFIALTVHESKPSESRPVQE